MVDALLIFYLLGLGRTEGNTMLGFVQAQLGAGSMFIAKLTLATAAGEAIWSRGRSDLLRIASGLMGLVVAYNLVLATYAMMLPGPFRQLGSVHYCSVTSGHGRLGLW
jgi:hypothetical protein